jgi:hypothetical protein
MGKSYVDSWIQILVVGCCLDNEKTLAVTAKLTGFDKSSISYARSGKRFKKQLEIYHKYKCDPDYIDKHIYKISLRYNNK